MLSGRNYMNGLKSSWVIAAYTIDFGAYFGRSTSDTLPH